MLLLLALVALLGISTTSQAATVNINFGYGYGYPSISYWNTGYFGYGWGLGYMPYHIYVGPRYYRPVRYPQLSAWRRYELRMIASNQMEQKRAIYFARKAYEAKENEIDQTPVQDIQIHIDDKNSDHFIPDELDPNKNEFKPKSTEVLSNGSVVMNTY